MASVSPLEDARGGGLLMLQLLVILRLFRGLVLLKDVVLFFVLDLGDGSHVAGS